MLIAQVAPQFEADDTGSNDINCHLRRHFSHYGAYLNVHMGKNCAHKVDHFRAKKVL